MEEYILEAFGLTGLSFRSGASRERISKALEYASDLYEGLKAHGGSLSRDRLLAILLIGVTDDLLRQREANAENERCLQEMVRKIDMLLSAEGFEKP